MPEPHLFRLQVRQGSEPNRQGFLGTPDGRRGWVHDFLLAGFEVFVVDQPGRGRSGYSNKLYGDYIDRELDVDDCERRFTSMKDLGNWPQAKYHSQWPDKGRRGDKYFEQFLPFVQLFLNFSLK